VEDEVKFNWNADQPSESREALLDRGLETPKDAKEEPKRKNKKKNVISDYNAKAGKVV
jgi:hypothetical protein